jgi:hypothetical protein
MAGRARKADQQVTDTDRSEGSEQVTGREQRADTTTRPGGGTDGGPGARTATVHLPFVTAQFRAPEVHLPGREQVEAAARSVGSVLPSPTTALFFGGLAVTVAIGAIEWPVAAAIGVGTALAARSEVRPAPRAELPAAPDPARRPARVDT